MIRLQQHDDDETPRSNAADIASTESEMTAGSLQHAADVRGVELRNRRMRNWFLLANLFVWIIILVLLRWLFF